MADMKPLSGILSNTQEASKNNDAFVWSNQPEYAGKPGTPEPVICEYCGAERHTKGVVFLGMIKWMPYGAERCTCQGAVSAFERAEAERKAKEEAEARELREMRLRLKVAEAQRGSGMGARFQRRTFDTFVVTEENKRAAQIAGAYVTDFDKMLPSDDNDPGRNGLFIAGPPGTGKTHIAAAIANHLIAQGRPVICMTMIDLLDRIRKTFSGGNTKEVDVLEVYKTVPLLVIDDMGKEPPTEWAISTIYNIINGRYEAYLPTIVTTNYDTDALIARMTPRETRDDTTARATIDRLMEMCRGVTLAGESWRSR